MKKYGLIDYVEARTDERKDKTPEDDLRDKDEFSARTGITGEEIITCAREIADAVPELSVLALLNPAMVYASFFATGLQYGYEIREQHQRVEDEELAELLRD